MTAYLAKIFTNSKEVARSPFETITAARKWAETFDIESGYCSIERRNGVQVARHNKSVRKSQWEPFF